MVGSIQRRPGGGTHLRRAACLTILALIALRTAPAAHPIPESVTIQVAAKAEGQRLRILIQLPVAAMRDIDFALASDGSSLDLTRTDAALRLAADTWLVSALPVFEGDRPLDRPSVASLRLDVPSDRSFSNYERAVAHMGEPPLPPDARIPLATALFTTVLEYPITSDRARFSVDPQFARMGIRVATVLRFQLPDGSERVFTFSGDPGLVRMDPAWYQAAGRFVALGFEHILSGIDHLLFLVCLVLPVRRFRQLALIVTAFTVAHSITLFAAAFGHIPQALWFPPLVETLIAASIVYMALENIVISLARKTDATGDAATALAPALSRRWAIAFGFGLVHGFGFSFALQEKLQLAGSHLVTSLVSFNFGVELGQLLVLAVLVPVVWIAFRAIEARIAIMVVSALVAHTAWHWMTDRGATLWGYDWSATDPADLASLLRWLMLIVGVAGATWLARRRKHNN